MAKCIILLALASITINVGLSGSVDHFGSHNLLSSASWKTNFQDKFNLDKRKSFGLLFPQIFLTPKPLDKVITLNSLDNVNKSFHLRKQMPFYIHARSKIPKRSNLFNDSAELIKNVARDQSVISHLTLRKPIAGIRPFHKSSSEGLIVKTDRHEEFVDFDKYVSFGKPYKSSVTSTTNHSENQSDLYYEYNKSPSFYKTIPTTKPYKNSDGSISIDETTEPIKLLNHSGLVDFDKYVSFGKPYKTEENLADNILKSLDNKNISHKVTSEEVKEVIYPVLSDFNKFASFGIPYKPGKNSTSIPSRSDESTTESIELENHSNLVDFDKYVSFGIPYKTEESKIANDLKQGLKSHFIVFDNTTEENTSEHKALAAFIVDIKKDSVAATPLNTFQNIESTEKGNYTNHFDITGFTTTDLAANDFNARSYAVHKTKKIEPSSAEDNVALLNNTRSSELSNSSNILSVNAHEALGLPIAFQLPIEEHNYLEINETPVSKTKCELLEGKPLIVCTSENSNNVSTITFDVPSKYSSMFAAMITDALSENNTNLYNKETFQVISEALNATRIEENIPGEKEFVEANDNLKGSQISRRYELLKSEGLMNAGNYELENIDEGSGEAE